MCYFDTASVGSPGLILRNCSALASIILPEPASTYTFTRWSDLISLTLQTTCWFISLTLTSNTVPPMLAKRDRDRLIDRDGTGIDEIHRLLRSY